MGEVLNILVAEDEETDAFFIEQAFKKTNLKNNLYFVKDGQEAIDFILGKGEFEDVPIPHLIIMDINMPRKNGHEALRDIKSMPEFRHVPILMLSGSKSDEDIKKSYANFASAHIPKASGLDEMKVLIENIESFWFSQAAIPMH